MYDSLNYDDEVSKQANLPGYKDSAITSYQERSYGLDACYDGQPWQYNQEKWLSKEMAEYKQEKKLKKNFLK